MSNDHPADRIRVDKAHVQAEWNQVVLQDSGLQVQVSWDKSPQCKDRQETVERLERIVAALNLYLHDVDNA